MSIRLSVEGLHFHIAAATIEALGFLQRSICFQAQSSDTEAGSVPLERGKYLRADT